MVTYVASMSWLLWITLLWTLGCIILAKYPKVELLDCMVVLLLTFWGTTIVAVQIYISTNTVQGFAFLHILPTLVVFCVLMMPILMGVRWYLIVGFDLHFPNINDVEHLFMCLLAICMSSWENVYSGPLPTFYLGCFRFLLSYMSYWRRQWQLTPVLLPGKSHGRRSLIDCSPWGCEESDTTERLHFHFSLSCIGEGNGNPLQCSCLENPRDRGAWWAAVSGVTQVRHDWSDLAAAAAYELFVYAGY